jgi:hypothetical protein
MTARRSLVVALAGCLPLSFCAFVVPALGSNTTCAGALEAHAAGASQGLSLPHKAPRPATLAQFAPWKLRTKVVLTETDDKVVMESDLGPAYSVARCSCSDPGLVRTRRLPATPPLRC